MRPYVSTVLLTLTGLGIFNSAAYVSERFLLPYLTRPLFGNEFVCKDTSDTMEAFDKPVLNVLFYGTKRGSEDFHNAKCR